MSQFETVIGLEVHAQLKTDSKIFCGCSTQYGAPPNTNICPVCTGQPGVLPVLNRKAVSFLVTTGLALGCSINPRSLFARKQYFYPDLPKNYQISQYELPLAERGCVDIVVAGETKRIRVHRIHLEEDAGKLLHAIGARTLDYSLVDLNRTGVPLMEIVSEPDLRSPEEAVAYLTKLKSILEYLGVSDCDMEEGKFRCDANVSIRPVGQKELGTKAEIKNMNSFSGVRDAIAYEVERQKNIIASGGKIVQETRLWNADTKESHSMRSKEEAHDYRYFPDPDLVPIELDERYLDSLRKELPELPEARCARLVGVLGLSAYDAGVITAEKALADYYEEALKTAGGEPHGKTTTPDAAETSAAKMLANWTITELIGRLNTAGKTIVQSPVVPQHLGRLVFLVRTGALSGKMGKTVIEEMFISGRPPEEIIKEKGLVQISDETAIGKLCDEALTESPKAIEEYKAGKERALGALVGLVMKKSKGQANPAAVNKILKEKLS
ncbi:MAG: Asp-tRNA(Asn)/Glu-tRNA(Gln) amidotransferase subunit GatB [Elusimicrobia bacterium]|nr:Asp-tRNA(Asn)/Glu-tRNA(Gln) amidotransferase subunit GatB [Elusimicrobiota bacterium]